MVYLIVEPVSHISRKELSEILPCPSIYIEEDVYIRIVTKQKVKVNKCSDFKNHTSYASQSALECYYFYTDGYL